MTTSSSDDVYKRDLREPCQYGSSCYRKSKDHLTKFKHPPKNVSPAPKKDSGTMKQQKLNVFFKKGPNLTKDTECKRRHSEDTDTEQPACSSKPVGDNISAQKVEKLSINEENNEDKTHHNSELDEHECCRVIKKLFLVNMPKDFYDFWQFCKSLSPKKPQDAFESIDLQLIGPFDVITGLIDDSLNSSAALRHWRYYYDPPEFQTVIRCTRTESFHIGYFRDEPNSLPVFVASNFPTKNATITPIGENLFAALDWCIKESEKTATPFKKVKSSNFKTELHNWAKKHDYILDKNTENMRVRDRKVVARTFHNAGIVVPYDKKTELGYRPIAETANNLTKLLKKIDTSKSEDERKVYFSELSEIVTWANIAMDEGDYGTCLELGLNLFSFGSPHLHKLILQLLIPSYDLLSRSAFGSILKAHLEDRKKGNALSALGR